MLLDLFSMLVCYSPEPGGGDPVPDPVPTPEPDTVPDPNPDPDPDITTPDPNPVPDPEPTPDPVPEPDPDPVPDPDPEPEPEPTPEPIPEEPQPNAEGLFTREDVQKIVKSELDAFQEGLEAKITASLETFFNGRQPKPTPQPVGGRKPGAGYFDI